LKASFLGKSFRRTVFALLAAVPLLMRGAEATNSGWVVRQDFLVQNWQLDQGLPRNSIISLAQDQRGYLWFGTPNGLIRFDGARFTAFETDSPPGFKQGQVHEIRCDDQGELWIATRRAGAYRGRRDTITPATADQKWMQRAVDSIVQDAEGVIWATDGTGDLARFEAGEFVTTARLGKIASGPMLFKLTTDANGGLWFFKQDTFGRLIDGQATNYITLPGQVLNLAPSRDGGMWLSTGNDLRRIPPGQPGRMEPVTPLPFGLYGVSKLYEDRSGVLWVGTVRDGLFCWRSGVLEKVEGVHHLIWDILEDAEHNIWVGTDGAGLFKVRARIFQLSGEPEGLPRDTVLSVSENWLAPRGGGLGRLRLSGAVEVFPEHAANSVTALVEDGREGVWLGTAGGRLIHRAADGTLDSTVTPRSLGVQLRVMHRARSGELWIGGFPSGLFRLAPGQAAELQDCVERGFPKVAVTAIAEATNGDIWIGTSSGDLHRYAQGRFESFGEKSGLPRFWIGSLAVGKDNSLWVGTLGGGLGRFREGRAEFPGRKVELVDDVVSQLVEDDSGWLWIGSTRGISRVRVAELESVLAGRSARAAAVHYTSSDGLANVQCSSGSHPSVWMTREGILRFATSKGVLSFDPAALPMNLRPPPLILEELLVDGQRVKDQGEVFLPHNLNKLEFRYSAMSFVAPEKVLFRRRLVGFDESWIEDGTARSAVYPRLQPGHYIFQFTASNNDGVWNDEKFSLHFEVIPAFWQTVWFRGVGAGVLAGIGGGVMFLVARFRMRRKLAQLEQANALERERTRISRDLHDDLGARLTQMALLTDLAGEDPSASVDLKSQIRAVSHQARNAVQSLDETVWLMNPKKDTLAQLIGYTARYAEQFFEATSIACRLEICRHAPACSVPGNIRRDIFLLVKEALNNVLKHSGAREVWLKIAVRGSVLRIIVQDNGKGFEMNQPHSQRHGLENMRRRADGAGIKLVTRSQTGAGARITLRVRLQVKGTAFDAESAAG
jgi:signal transduction histidine kinase/ligand-binding sensor domain-containing protein